MLQNRMNRSVCEPSIAPTTRFHVPPLQTHRGRRYSRSAARRRMTPLVFLGLLLVSCGCADLHRESRLERGERSAIRKNVLRVGAWNIEWLGTPDSRSGVSKGVLQSPDDLADYILAADVDILGVCEVAQSVKDGPLENEVLGAALRIVSEKRGGRWVHELFPARSGRNQLCGFAWDTSVVEVRSKMAAATAAEAIPGEENIWSRPPPVLLFSAGEGLTDFAVVMLHMKSNYNGDFSAQRGREAHHLVRDLPRTAPDRDVIIMGDTNCNKHTEPAIHIICDVGFVDLTPKDARTFWRGDSALDRIFVPTDQPEFATRRFDILRDDYLSKRTLKLEEFKRRYSDHFMVITEIVVMEDDD